jgi:hypothetical protein
MLMESTSRRHVLGVFAQLLVPMWRACGQLAHVGNAARSTATTVAVDCVPAFGSIDPTFSIASRVSYFLSSVLPDRATYPAPRVQTLFSLARSLTYVLEELGTDARVEVLRQIVAREHDASLHFCDKGLPRNMERLQQERERISAAFIGRPEEFRHVERLLKDFASLDIKSLASDPVLTACNQYVQWLEGRCDLSSEQVRELRGRLSDQGVSTEEVDRHYGTAERTAVFARCNQLRAAIDQAVWSVCGLRGNRPLPEPLRTRLLSLAGYVSGFVSPDWTTQEGAHRDAREEFQRKLRFEFPQLTSWIRDARLLSGAESYHAYERAGQ